MTRTFRVTSSVLTLTMLPSSMSSSGGVGVGFGFSTGGGGGSPSMRRDSIDRSWLGGRWSRALVAASASRLVLRRCCAVSGVGV